MIYLNAIQIDVKSPGAQALKASVGDFSGKRMHLVRFNGPVKPEWLKMLNDAGAQVVDYIPNYTYLVYGDAPSLQKIQSQAFAEASPIEWDADYKSEYRISPDVFNGKAKDSVRSLASSEFQVQLFKDDEQNARTLELIKSLQSEPIKEQQEVLHYVNLVVGLDQDGITKLSEQPDVISIHPYFEPKKLDERQDILLAGDLTANSPTAENYLTYLASKGITQAKFDASGFIVDLSDSGIDNANVSAPNQFLLYAGGDPAGKSRFVYSRLEGTPHSGSTLQGCDGHGNLNATIIGGYVPNGGIFASAPHADASGFRYGLGVAPFVKIGSSVIFDPNSFTNPNFANLQSQAYNDGARISSNSWGSASNGYTADAQAYDALVRDAQPSGSTFPNAGNQEMVMVFAAGNAGSAAGTVGTPATGKNIISVGASEGVQPFGGADQCAVNDTQADSANDIASFSSRGPTSDGRIKPDIVLPGTHISGGVPQATRVSPVSGTGAQLACFTAGGVCGGTGTSNFWPLGQQWYTSSSGTSHSTPAVAGTAAIIRQFFINQGLAPPSPAMTKAIMLNSARYLNGAGANDALPSNNQGMGKADLDNFFDIFAGPRVIHDELAADRFTGSGQQRVVAGTIANSSKPFRVTLAWTDAPGSTTGNAFVNDLDLEVTIGGVTYKGNVFNGANSVSGGTADPRNNVESVFLPPGVSGTFAVTIKATNIAGDGVPNNADALDQDYALVVQNANESTVAVVKAGTAVITAESAIPANNAPDPGETVTVSLPLQNIGTANSGNTTATLQATGGVLRPSNAQSYGVLNFGQNSVSKSFSFEVDPALPCAGTLTMTWSINDGTGNSTYVQTLAVGAVHTTPTTFSNNTLINLPAGQPPMDHRRIPAL